jgi:hypothetical protein
MASVSLEVNNSLASASDLAFISFASASACAFNNCVLAVASAFSIAVLFSICAVSNFFCANCFCSNAWLYASSKSTFPIFTAVIMTTFSPYFSFNAYCNCSLANGSIRLLLGILSVVSSTELALVQIEQVYLTQDFLCS